MREVFFMPVLQVTRSARYWLYRAHESTKAHVWIALHGYGHSLTSFTPLLTPLVEHQQTVLAPEALSRFYLKGTSGPVGATWMTSDDRELDIQDNHSYLQEIVLYLKQSCNVSKLVLFGFSQGCTTALRWWIATSPPDVSAVVAWAGNLPHEYAMEDLILHAPDTPLWLVAGRSDPYLTDAFIQNIEYLSQNRPNCFLVWFEGTHTVDAQVLSEVCAVVQKHIG